MSLNRLFQVLSEFLPLTYQDIITRQLKGVSTVLDIGCGKGYLMRYIRSRVWVRAIGLDAYKPYTKEAKGSLVYDCIILADARFLPFKYGSFDAVLASQLIEHLEKSEAVKLLSEIECIASNKVIIGTPVGFIPPGYVDEDNPHLIHKSGWNLEEFVRRGYKIRGQGLRVIYGGRGLVHRLPTFLRPILFVFSYLISPLTYFIPVIAAHMVCVKFVSQK